MSRIAYCPACSAQEHGVKSRIALEHTCGLERGDINPKIKATENIKLLEKENVYFETVFNGKACYKYQVAGEDIIVVQRDKKEDAADEMVERLKEKGLI